MSIHIEAKDFIRETPQAPKTIADFLLYCTDLHSTYTQYDERAVFPFHIQIDGTVAVVTFDNTNWLKTFSDFTSENYDALHNDPTLPIVWVDNDTGYTVSIHSFGEDMIARDKDDHQYFSVVMNP